MKAKAAKHAKPAHAPVTSCTPEEAAGVIYNALRRVGIGFHETQSPTHGGGRVGGIEDVYRIVDALRVLLAPPKKLPKRGHPKK